jgi:hypothetical protein
LEARGVSLRFGARALTEVSFRVNDGELFLIIGPIGAGPPAQARPVELTPQFRDRQLDMGRSGFAAGKIRGGSRRIHLQRQARQALPVCPVASQIRTLSEARSWQRFKRGQNRHQDLDIAIDEEAPPVRAHNLDPPAI